MSRTAQVLPAWYLPGMAGGAGKSLLLCPSLLWQLGDFEQVLLPGLRPQEYSTEEFPRRALGSNRVSIRTQAVWLQPVVLFVLALGLHSRRELG